MTGTGVEQGVQGGRQIMKLLAEGAGWKANEDGAAASGLAKLQKNDKRPKAESATPYAVPLPFSRCCLSRDTARGVAKVFAPRWLYTGSWKAKARGGACRLLFPKVFLFSSAEASASTREGNTRAGILRHCQRHFVCFIIFYYHLAFVSSYTLLLLRLLLLIGPVVVAVVLLLWAKLNWPLRCTKDADFADLPSRSPSVSIVAWPAGA